MVILLNIENSYFLRDNAEVEMMMVKLQKSKVEKFRTPEYSDIVNT